jgi:hypothetical protein
MKMITCAVAVIAVLALTGAVEWVTPAEAARAMIAWAAQEYGEGTPGFAAVVLRAVELLAGHGFTPAGKPIAGTS